MGKHIYLSYFCECTDDDDKRLKKCELQWCGDCEWRLSKNLATARKTQTKDISKGVLAGICDIKDYIGFEPDQKKVYRVDFTPVK